MPPFGLRPAVMLGQVCGPHMECVGADQCSGDHAAAVAAGIHNEAHRPAVTFALLFGGPVRPFSRSLAESGRAASQTYQTRLQTQSMTP